MEEHAITMEKASFPRQVMDDLKKYLPLYKAILERNSDFVKKLCNSDEHALEAKITVQGDTALHVAVGTGKANHIVKYLLTKMSQHQVTLKNKDGNTVLSIAAIVGNVEAARQIMKIRPDLNHVENNCGFIPLIEAAQHGQRKMIKYLGTLNEDIFKADGGYSTFGFPFVKSLIDAGFYDLALKWVKDNRSLATIKVDCDESLLSAIARKMKAFPSGVRNLGFPSLEKTDEDAYDSVHKLVKLLCEEITTDYERASSMLKRPFLLAAKLGAHEVVEAIIVLFPDAIWFLDTDNHNVLQLAVMNRREEVFKLIFQMSHHKHLLLMSKDNFGNNILHLAGKLAPQNGLHHICGAALQMKYELQWFKAVKMIVKPAYEEDKNSEEKTPAMVFTDEHEKLVKEGEIWMKGAASSCTVAAALIATVVFAAAVNVPGGNRDDGLPNFYNEIAFKIFYYSNLFSLYTSVISILIFLSVLTARYAEYDFLSALPRRLVFGLLMLFCSVSSLLTTAAMAATLATTVVKKVIIIILVALLTAQYSFLLLPLTQNPILMLQILFARGPRIYG